MKEVVEIVRLFNLDDDLAYSNVYHLSPDSNGYVFFGPDGEKYVLFETDFPSGASYDKVSVESIGVRFRKWILPRAVDEGEDEESKIFVQQGGLKYALALVEDDK